MIGRRWFASMLPAAAAAPVLMRSAPPPTSVMSKGAIMGLARESNYIEKVAAQLARPAGLQKFYEAQDAISKTRHYMNELREIQRYGQPDLNITALRSVSKQHKLRMQLDQKLTRARANESFFDKLKDVFGVRDYFKKMQESGPQVPSDAASGSRY